MKVRSGHGGDGAEKRRMLDHGRRKRQWRWSDCRRCGVEVWSVARLPCSWGMKTLPISETARRGGGGGVGLVAVASCGAAWRWDNVFGRTERATGSGGVAMRWRYRYWCRLRLMAPNPRGGAWQWKGVEKRKNKKKKKEEDEELAVACLILSPDICFKICAVRKEKQGLVKIIFYIIKNIKYN